MYFCPCSCSKTDCENEEDVLIYLPRNLSYAGESYLDRYSVSSAFVHNSKLEKQLLQSDVEEHYLKAGAAASAEAKKELEEGEEEEEGDSKSLLGARAMAQPVTCTDDTVFRGGPDECDVGVGDTSMALPTTTTTTTTPDSMSSPLLPTLTVTIDRDKNSDSEAHSSFDRYVVKTVESPDSDLVSEEGIFVNMMDDLDGLGAGAGGKSTLSEASDDTYVSGDSMYYSPVEVEEMEDEQVRGELKVSLEEAVQQAAFTFQVSTSATLLPQQSPDDSAHPDDSSVTVSLPCLHDNVSQREEEASTAHNTDLEGAKKDGNDTSSEDSENDKKDRDGTSTDQVNPPSADADNGASYDGTIPLLTRSRKITSSLEIHLNDMSLQNEDRGPLSSSYRDLLSPDSPLYEDREFNFTRTQLRKSTSLKSTKTPPGTPRRKKVVRFADAMGLDLESVRHVLNLESPPKIPPSAMKDLQAGLSEDRKAMGTRYITETFTQPGADVRFRERVLAEKVVLENALIVSGSITGVVRVANIAFHKAVRVRFTTNSWASFHDIAASYMVNSNDGATDRFSFTLVPPPDFCPGSRMECAISYSVNGAEYWDNNNGTNYVFECYAKTIPTEAENAWMHFL